MRKINHKQTKKKTTMQEYDTKPIKNTQDDDIGKIYQNEKEKTNMEVSEIE